MSSLVTNPIKNQKEAFKQAEKISNIISNIGFVDEKEREFSLSKYVYYLLKAVENSDQKTKSQIENNIVSIGEKAVPYLVESLMTTTGPTRGLVAMALIRIGKSSLTHLMSFAINNPENAWVADYIANEINGTMIPLKNISSQKEVIAV